MNPSYAVNPEKVCLNDAVAEAFRIPAAVDLFCRAGARSAAELAGLGRAARLGLIALASPDLPSCPGELKARRLMAEGFEGAELLPLPSALKKDGTMAEIGLMCAAGEKMFFVPEGCEDWRRLRNLFCYASDFDCRIAVLPCMKELCEKGQIHEGDTADRLGMKGVSVLSELCAVRVLLELAAERGTALHLRGLSCAASLDAVAEAREHGLDVTCDVAAMNLLYTHDLYSADLDPAMKLYPVLRAERDRMALWKGLDCGVVTAITTNHSARGLDELALPFEEAPFGNERLDFIPALFAEWDRLGRPCSADSLLSALSDGPAALLGRKSAGSTLIFRSGSQWKCCYEPQKSF